MTDYARWGKAYYAAHRAEILEGEKERKRWVEYYAKNREAIAERNRRRYYEKKGLPVPEKFSKAQKPKEPRAPRVPKTPAPEVVSRFEELIAELRVLAPQVVKKGRSKKKPVLVVSEDAIDNPVPVLEVTASAELLADKIDALPAREENINTE